VKLTDLTPEPELGDFGIGGLRLGESLLGMFLKQKGIEAITNASVEYDDVYAVGIAAAVHAPWHTPTPVGVPETGSPTEAMAQVAAQVRGETPGEEHEFKDIRAVGVMDAGNNGVIVLADTMLPPKARPARP
jgi:hypothetical protein